MEEDKEYFENWERALEKAGYRSTVPVSEIFSRDLTEATIMIQFWIDQGIIVRDFR